MYMAMVKLDFRNLLREFLETSDMITVEEDVIRNSDTISDDVKKELLDTLARTEKYAKSNTGIPKSLKVNHKKAIKETLEKNSVKMDSKTEEVIKENKEEDIERE